MKARIKATGDIYDVIDMNDYHNRFKLEDNNWYTMGEVEIFEGSEPDWQQVRIHFAGLAMLGLISNERQIKLLNEGSIKNAAQLRLAVCETSLQFADALIAELKKVVEQ